MEELKKAQLYKSATPNEAEQINLSLVQKILNFKTTKYKWEF